MDLFCRLIGQKSHLFSPSFQTILMSDHKEIAIMSDDPSDFYLAGSIRAHINININIINKKEECIYGFIDFLLSEKPSFVAAALEPSYRDVAKRYLESKK